MSGSDTVLEQCLVAAGKGPRLVLGDSLVSLIVLAEFWLVCSRHSS